MALRFMHTTNAGSHNDGCTHVARSVSLEVSTGDDIVMELTWGQREIWEIICRISPNDEHLNASVVLCIGRSVEESEVLEWTRAILQKHASLRTRYESSHSGSPQQRILAKEEIPLAVVEAGACCSQVVVKAVEEQYLNRRFDLATELPVRIAIVSEQGVPRTLVLVISHMAIDGMGIDALKNELNCLLGTSQPCLTDDEGPWNPMDQVLFERTDLARDREMSALRYIEEQFLQFPDSIFNHPIREEGDLPYRRIVMRSQAFSGATTTLALRLSVSRASTALAALSFVLAYRAKLDSLPFFITVANRFKENRVSVGSYAQRIPLAIAPAGHSFFGLIRYTQKAFLRAYGLGPHSPERRDGVASRVSEKKGYDVSRGILFNVQPGRAARPAAEIADYGSLHELSYDTDFSLEGGVRRAMTLHVVVWPPDALEVVGDIKLIPIEEIRKIARLVEMLTLEGVKGDFYPPQILPTLDRA